MRASDADRERAADVLRTAGGEGRLTVDELDERLHAAYRATERAELERLVADVRVEPGEFLPAPAGRTVVRRRAGRHGPDRRGARRRRPLAAAGGWRRACASPTSSAARTWTSPRPS